jgi:hypothetical protein
MTGTERSLARIDKSDLLRLAALAAEVEASQGLRCLVVLRGPRRPPFPYRWRGTADFGPAKLGRYPPDRVAAIGQLGVVSGTALDAVLARRGLQNPAIRRSLHSHRSRSLHSHRS